MPDQMVQEGDRDYPTKSIPAKCSDGSNLKAVVYRLSKSVTKYFGTRERYRANMAIVDKK